MKILVNAICRGGIGRYGLLLGQALSRRPEVSARVMVSDEVRESGLFGTICQEIGATPVALRSKSDKLHALRRLRREIADFQPDIVHDTSGCSGPLAPWAWFSLPAGARLAVTEHDVLPHSMMGQTAMKRFARRQIRRRPDRVVVHGETSRRQFLSACSPGRNRPGVSVIPHGALGVFAQGARARCDDGRRTVLFFGALRPNKGLDWLPEIADRIRERHPNVRFLVAGSPRISREFAGSDWNRRLPELLRAFRERDDFELHDRFIPDDEVGDLFLRSDICLLPYRDATASGVAALAMPLGSVVVGTRVGDLPEQLGEGQLGVVVAPDPADIASALNALLASPEQIETLRRAARDHASKVLCWGSIAERHLACYLDVLGAER